MEPQPLPPPSLSEPSGSFSPPPLSSLQEGMGRRQGIRVLCRTVVWKITKVERTVEVIWSHTFILRSLVPQLCFMAGLGSPCVASVTGLEVLSPGPLGLAGLRELWPMLCWWQVYWTGASRCPWHRVRQWPAPRLCVEICAIRERPHWHIPTLPFH